MFYLMTDSEDAVPVEDWEQIGSALAAVTSRDTEFVVLSKDLDGDVGAFDFGRQVAKYCENPF